MFLRKDLDELLTSEAQPAVSPYLPTHVVDRETRQDAIRLNNLLAQGEQVTPVERPALPHSAQAAAILRY